MCRFILENALNIFGQDFFNSDLYDNTHKLTNGQVYNFEFNVPQMDKFGKFNLNWLMTADPYINNRMLDLAFWMDLGPEESRCYLDE